jgi:multicomponent K+:H+ antiporter subunit E
MTIIRWLLPFPLLTLTALLLWLALAPAITLGQALLGGVVALLVPWLTAKFWPDRPTLLRPLSGLRLFLIVVFDILVANWAVARLVVGPLDRLHPAFLDIPLDLRDPFVATILGSIVSLTPGTVSVDVDTEHWVLRVHALDAHDEQAVITTIKDRYETPLREIFAC